MGHLHPFQLSPQQLHLWCLAFGSARHCEGWGTKHIKEMCAKSHNWADRLHPRPLLNFDAWMSFSFNYTLVWHGDSLLLCSLHGNFAALQNQYILNAFPSLGSNVISSCLGGPSLRHTKGLAQSLQNPNQSNAFGGSWMLRPTQCPWVMSPSLRRSECMVTHCWFSILTTDGIWFKGNCFACTMSLLVLAVTSTLAGLATACSWKNFQSTNVVSTWLP